MPPDPRQQLHLYAVQRTNYGTGTIPETLRKSCIGSVLPTCQVLGGAMVEWIKMGALSLLIWTLLMAAIIGPVLLLAH